MKSKIVSKEALEILLWNKKIQRRAIYCYIKKGASMLDLKKKILPFFSKKIRYEITDFRLVTRGPKESCDEKSDTIKDNFFDEKYNNEEAYDLMKTIKNSDYYKSENCKDTLIYFRIIKSTITTTFVDSNSSFSHSFPLSIENSSYSKLMDDIKKIIPDILDRPIYLFHNTTKMEKISKKVSMRQYSEHGLILYLFPIKAYFVNNSKKIKILLKFNEPLSYYMKEITENLNIKSNSNNLLFRIRKDANTYDNVDIKIPIHQLLKKQTIKPTFEIINIESHKINITIPYKTGNSVDINFEYKSNEKINDLINNIKYYFNIEDQNIKLLQNDDSEANSVNYIKDFKSLFLKYDQSFDLKITRSFIINNEKIQKSIALNKKVITIIKEISDEYNSDKSLINLMIDNKLMNIHDVFANYFIPPTKEILVNMKKFENFLTFNIYESNKDTIKIYTGFTPQMKIKSLKNCKEFKEKVSKKLQSELFFFYNEKLDEQKTFNYYNINKDAEINGYASKYYLYKFKDEFLPVSFDIKFDDLMTKLQSHFNLNPDQFFIDQKGKILTKKNYPNLKLENGTILELKIPTKMTILVDDKYEIKAISTQQVKDVLKNLSDQSQIPQGTIQLFNDLGVQLRSDSYLYSSFTIREENHIYKSISRKAKRFTFQNRFFKFFEESFLPSMKISEVLTELRSIGKKIEENSFIIFMGRVIGNNDTLSSLIIESKDDDDEDDTRILLIENEMPKQIKIDLNFKFDKTDESSENYEIYFIKPTEALNIRYWASLISHQPLDLISLVAKNEMLNDDDEIEEDTEIIVGLNPLQSKEQNEEKVQEAITITANNIARRESEEIESNTLDLSSTQIIQQNAKKVKESSDDDDSSLEYYDEDDDEDDPFAKGNGTYGPATNGQEDEYIFKFKIINGDEMPLQLPKNITVKEVKEKIAQIQDTDVENISIFVGNQRLADFNRLTYITIPETVSYFAVKIIDLQNTLVCSRVRLR